jgi:WD40 repeat protein
MNESIKTDPLQRVNKSASRRVFDWLFGHDYFLAHRSVDGKPYAAALYEHLSSKGNELDCFLDVKHYSAGKRLFEMQSRALKKTSRLIVIVTPKAHDEEANYLHGEVAEFKRQHPGGLIVPIGSLTTLSAFHYPQSKLLPLLPHLPNDICIIQQEEELLTGCPSPDAVTKLLNDFTEERNSTKRLRWIRRVAMGLALLLVVAIGLGIAAILQAEIARKERDNALIGQSQVLASRANDMIREGRIAEGISIALSALPASSTKPDKPYVAAAEAALRSGVALIREKSVFEAGSESLDRATMTKNGQYLATLSGWGELRLWDLVAGKHLRLLAERKTSTEDSHGMATFCAFDNGGNRIVITARDHKARICDIGGLVDLPLIGHTGPLNHAVFSPDSKTLATASDDSTVRVWNSSDGRLLGTLKGHKGEVRHVEFDQRGERIISASTDGTARVWNATTFAEMEKLDNGVSLGAAHFSPDGTRILTFTDTRVTTFGPPISDKPIENSAALWDASTGERYAKLIGHTEKITQGSFSPDSLHILTVAQDGTARIWSTSDGKLAGTYSDLPNEAYVLTHGIEAGVFLGDGKEFITAHHDHRLRFWRVDQRLPTAVLSAHTSSVTDLSLADNGTFATCSSDGTARLWNVQNREDSSLIANTRSSRARLSKDQKFLFTSPPPLLNSGGSVVGDKFAIPDSGGASRELQIRPFGIPNPDGTRIVIIQRPKPSEATLMETSSWKEIANLSGHSAKVSGAVVSKDGRYFVTYCGRVVGTLGFGPRGKDPTAKVWDANDGHLIATLSGDGGNVEKAAFGPQSDVVATGSLDGVVRIWKIPEGYLIRELRGTGRAVLDLSFSPDGLILAAASSDGTVQFWRVTNGQEISQLKGHSGAIEDIAFCDKGRYFISASKDGTARIWMTDPPKLHKFLKTGAEGINFASFSPDGKYAITAMVDPMKYEGDGAFGGFLNERTADRSISVWDVQSGELLQKLRHDEPLTSLFVHESGYRMVSTSGILENTLRIWDIFPDTNKAIKEALLALPKRVGLEPSPSH